METKKFNWIPFICGGVCILLVVGIATLVETQFRNPQPLTNALERTTQADISKPTVTIVEKELVVEDITYPIEKPTEPPTEKPTEKPTQKQKEEKVNKPKVTEDTPTNEPEQPQTPYVPPEIVPPTPQPPIAADPAPTPSVDDIVLSPSVLYLKPGEQGYIQIVYPPGLPTQGSDWRLDNQAIVSFVSAEIDVVTVQAKAVGTTIVYANPKGTGVTLSCTVIVSN